MKQQGKHAQNSYGNNYDYAHAKEENIKYDSYYEKGGHDADHKFLDCFASNSALLLAIARDPSTRGDLIRIYGKQLCACCFLFKPCDSCRHFVEAQFSGLLQLGDPTCNAEGNFSVPAA